MSAVSGAWKKAACREKNGEESRAGDSAAEAPAKEIPPPTHGYKGEAALQILAVISAITGTIWDNRS